LSQKRFRRKWSFIKLIPGCAGARFRLLHAADRSKAAEGSDAKSKAKLATVDSRFFVVKSGTNISILSSALSPGKYSYIHILKVDQPCTKIYLHLLLNKKLCSDYSHESKIATFNRLVRTPMLHFFAKL
jgi:hypothetical protein